MTLADDLRTEVKAIFAGGWSERDGQKVPEPADLKLGNDGINLDATVLYADMDGSTKLVDNHSARYAVEVYKSYLTCAARIIKYEGGVITAYDGDRIMAVFIGDFKNTVAARTALKINYAVNEIVNPALKAQYPKENFVLKHVVGVDTSKLLVARIGVRNDNDIVWAGRAGNHAAKLTEISNDVPIFITGDVFDKLADGSKLGANGQPMWTRRQWTPMNNARIYSSNWQWKP